MSELPAARLLPPNPDGRTFSTQRTVRLGDVGPDGALRWDAVARYLQDVATDDALDAGLVNAMGWVVRRTMIRMSASAQVNEQVGLTTFCTGAGRSWAERRTTITSSTCVVAEGVSLWVQIDVQSGRPVRLGDGFSEIYGAAARGRLVSSRLQLPRPPDDGARRSWSFRRADLDPFDHVNNAAQWSLVEELMADHGRLATVEVEYLAPVGTQPLDLVVDAGHAWLVDGDRTSTAIAWRRGT